MAELALTTALMNAGAPAFLVNAASYIPAAVSTIGTIGQGLGLISTIQGAQSSAAASKANARIAENNAAIAESQTEAALERQRKVGLIASGASRAVAGSRGLGTGSAYDILSDNAAQQELDLLNIKYEGLLKKTGYLQTAALDKANAKSTRRNMPYLAGGKLLMSSSRFGTDGVI